MSESQAKHRAVEGVESEARSVRTYTEEIAQNRATYRIEVGGTLDSHNTMNYAYCFGRNMMGVPRFEPNQFLTIENMGETDVINPKVVVNGEHDWYSIETLLAEVIHEGMTDEEKAFALWEVFQENFYHCNDPECYHIDGVLMADGMDPIRKLNSYENTNCHVMAIALATLWKAAGLDARVWNFATTHWVSEVYYSGAYHMLDSDVKVFYVKADNRTVASVEDCINDPYLIKRTRHYGCAAEEDLKDDESKGSWYCPNTGTRYAAPSGHTMAVTLRPGESIVRRWDNIGKFHDNWRHKEARPKFANGKIVYRPDLTKSYALRGAESVWNIASVAQDGQKPNLHGARLYETSSLIYKVKSPYCIVGGTVSAKFHGEGGHGFKIHLSFDGAHWTEVWHGSQDNLACSERIDSYIATGASVAKYLYYLKFEFHPGGSPTDGGIESLAMETDVEMSLRSLPTLRIGDNEVVYTDETVEEHQVRVSHGWREDSSNRPPESPKGPFFPSDGAEVDGPTFMLKWEAATDSDGDEIDGYHIQIRDRADMGIPISPNLERHTFSGEPEWEIPWGWLIPGKRYFWRVRARDGRGAWSGWSPIWSFVPYGPGVPVAVVKVVDGDRVMVGWRAGPGTSPVRYEVYGSDERGLTLTPEHLLAEVEGTEMTFLRGDPKDRAYYRIVAVDGKGNRSGASEQSRTVG